MRISFCLCVPVFALAIAGCASKAGKTGQEEFAYSTVVVELRPAPGAARAQAGQTALDYVNARREEVGLPAIAADHGIEAAASAHARYLAMNRAGTHEEIEGKPGFTGADVLTRVRLHTRAHSASEVVALIGASQMQSPPIEHIFASPYHRGALLFDWARGGEASALVSSASAGAVTVVDFADIAPALADHELIAWPYDGQTQVPAAWIDNEQPDPMGPESRYRGQVLGYPITLSGGPNAHIELKSFELRDARGSTIPCRIAPLALADAARNTAICTPYEPLRHATRYTVRAQGTLRQLSKRARFDLSWAFTTTSDAARPESVAVTGQR
ncbi:Allergen V5/Tpx-1 family protein [Caballeronia hypogeia]|uniref:Allergen V5/Tpx-1 family protein n=1 Tax=Caballeronia hypogeia TaxID=1777140 RepID=A0A157ZLH9_9BURK|nr:CAP domain-containing protein [Caballeronia hypogeia]SAK46384.1 Allergen V5/Tpx-1 family protein [Caballeronia hypogeia]